MIGQRGVPALAVIGLLLASGCSGQADEARPSPPADSSLSVGQFASANPGSVNTFWIRTSEGLVVVDAQRSLSDARRARDAIRRTGEPVAAILVTHPHPDHVGGLGVFHAAFPPAPIYASSETADFVRTDPLGFYALTRELPGSDYARRMTVPDRNISPGASLELAGATLRTAEFDDGETVSAVVFYEPGSGSLFAGDLVSNRMTPALLEGHTCQWLVQLDRLRDLFPDAQTLYPGHGAPGDPATLIARQVSYLRQVRAIVDETVRPTSPGGTALAAAERGAAVRELQRTHPGEQPVATLPDLIGANVDSVARELRTEDPATQPAPCRAW